MKISKSVKSILVLFLILIMVIALFSSCSNHLEENSSDKSQSGNAKDLKSIGITDPYGVERHSDEHLLVSLDGTKRWTTNITPVPDCA